MVTFVPSSDTDSEDVGRRRIFLFNFTLNLLNGVVYNSAGETIDIDEYLLQERNFFASGFITGADDESPSDETFEGPDLPGFWRERLPIHVDIGICGLPVHIGGETTIGELCDFNVDKRNRTVHFTFRGEFDVRVETI